MREVDDPHDAKDEGKADSEERVRAPQDQCIDTVLKEFVHARPIAGGRGAAKPEERRKQRIAYPAYDAPCRRRSGARLGGYRFNSESMKLHLAVVVNVPRRPGMRHF